MAGPAAVLTRRDVERRAGEHCTGRVGDERVGIELELLTFPGHDPTARVALDDLRAAAAAARLPAGSAITFEPGGQVEISTVPVPSVAAACDLLDRDLAALRAALDARDIATDAVGLDSRPPRQVVHAPRYDAMAAYFAARNGAGHTMMCSTAALQVNVDFGDASTAAERWRRAHALVPVLVALFANSPRATDSRVERSARAFIWHDIDPSRTAPALRTGDPAVDWASYALAAGVMFVRDGDGCAPPAPPMTLAEWVDGGGPRKPGAGDLDEHLTTLFPPVRPRGWIEMRAVDSLPDPWWRVAVAATAVLVADRDAAADVDEALAAAPIPSMTTAATLATGHPALQSVGARCLAITAAACAAASPELAEMTREYARRFVARRRTPADEVLERRSARVAFA